MQAEQMLGDNYVYEETESPLLSKYLFQLRQQAPFGVKRLDESSEAEMDNENSIPQESSIVANVSF